MRILGPLAIAAMNVELPPFKNGEHNSKRPLTNLFIAVLQYDYQVTMDTICLLFVSSNETILGH